jgi:hypothetical protein
MLHHGCGSFRSAQTIRGAECMLSENFRRDLHHNPDRSTGIRHPQSLKQESSHRFRAHQARQQMAGAVDTVLAVWPAP